jgi:hypothetical protein
VTRIAPLVLVALILAACGQSSAAIFTKQATEACLQQKNVHVGPVSNATDFVASTATGGAFRATLSDNFVTISFGLTLVDATNIDQAYEQFHAKNVGLPDVLRTENNAVMLWHQHPSDTDLALVTGCLKK